MKNKTPLIIIGIVAVAAIVGALIYANMGNTPPRVSNANKNAANTRANATPVNASAGAQPAWSKGAPNAQVTIEEFADFQCPSCAYFHTVLKEVKTVYGDRVRVTFRQYPLQQVHPHAYDAARAAEAAGVQGADKFWAMHDTLFEKQKEWSVMPNARDEFAKYAGQIGLDVEKFKTDMVGMIANSRVAADKKRGDEMRVGSTPSVFLNGRLLLPEEMTSPKMRQLIDAALMGNK
jgi:protein-disulfide isomerase